MTITDTRRPAHLTPATTPANGPAPTPTPHPVDSLGADVVWGPGMRPDDAVAWSARLDCLGRLVPDGQVTVNRGWDLTWEKAVRQTAQESGAEHVSVRIYQHEVVVGPRWVPGLVTSCAGCAEVRERSMLEHPLVGDLSQVRSNYPVSHPFLGDLVAAALPLLVAEGVAPGELLVIGREGVRRHRIARSMECPMCAPRDLPTVESSRPAVRLLESHRATEGDATRGVEGAALVERSALRSRLLDSRFGPVRVMIREARAPFAMSGAVLPDSPNHGYGRAATFAETEAVAILEAYERLGGFPFDTAVLTGLTHAEVADFAVDPTSLGQHTEAQLSHPSCKVMRSSSDTAYDWVWGHDLATGQPRLVPAEIGFFQYEYQFKRARRAARKAGPKQHRKYFHESSSGCAAGSSFEEASLHSLLELAERDAFLLSWHRRQPLPRVRNSSVSDPESAALIELIEARGFDLHVLVATQDIALPIVWVLAVNRAGRFPGSFSSGGSGAQPTGAIRSALREVAQLVTMDHSDWDQDRLRSMYADPWEVEELEDHPMLGALPEQLPRLALVTDGPQVDLADAFPGWPDRLRAAADGDLTGALGYIRDLYADAGLPEICVVDQSTREHRDVGIAVVKAVVPGITPMCFGYAQQRLAGLPRFAAAIAGIPQTRPDLPLDPHPFP